MFFLMAVRHEIVAGHICLIKDQSSSAEDCLPVPTVFLLLSACLGLACKNYSYRNKHWAASDTPSAVVNSMMLT